MYKRSAKGWAKHLDFIVLDCICLCIAFLTAYFIRHGFVNPFKDSSYKEIFIVMLLLNFVVILFMDTMKDVLKRGYLKEFGATLKQALGLTLCISAFMFFTKSGSDYSRISIFLTIVIHGVLSYVIRILWKKHVIRRLSNSTNNALLIMAGEKRAEILIEEVLNNNYGHHKIVGVAVHCGNKTTKVKANENEDASAKVSDNVLKSIKDIPVVATYDTIIEYVTKNWVDEILISVNSEDEFPEKTVDELVHMGVTVHAHYSGATDIEGVKQVVGNIGGLLVVTSTMNYMTPRQYIMKRTMDIFGSLIGCLFTGILFLILAPIIKIKSPGPVFFKQERIGKNGKPFKLYKFRSMYMDAEERKAELMAQNRLHDNLMFKMDFDPRVIGNRIDENGNKKTGIGEFIRKYSIDEFPQFFNVLKGDMSLVGTRPPVKCEYNEYSAHHKARLAIRPGITGLWQVSGRSDILDFEEVVKLDTQYINNWSVGLDLKILLKTVKAVVKKDGAV